MKKRIIISSFLISIYLLLAIGLIAFTIKDAGEIRLLDIIFNGFIFCGLLPLATFLAVLKWKRKGVSYLLTFAVLSGALLLHYMYAVFAVHSTYLHSFFFLLGNIVITLIVMYFYKRSQVREI